jgi:hypothetical protein
MRREIADQKHGTTHTHFRSGITVAPSQKLGLAIVCVSMYEWMQHINRSAER